MEIGHTELLVDLAAKFPPYNNKNGKDIAMGSSAATAAIVCLGCLQPKEIVRADVWTQKKDYVFEEHSCYEHRLRIQVRPSSSKLVQESFDRRWFAQQSASIPHIPIPSSRFNPNLQVFEKMEHIKLTPDISLLITPLGTTAMKVSSP